jgi:hypothetical protein
MAMKPPLRDREAPMVEWIISMEKNIAIGPE